MHSHAINTRRDTEALLLFLGAIPVMFLYGMYLYETNVELSPSAFAVPIGLFVAFTASHIAVRIFAPAADPVILPIVFVLAGTGITFVTRVAPSLVNNQILWLFVSVIAMVITLIAIPRLDALSRYKYTMGTIGIIALLLPIVPFLGKNINGSRIWINIANHSFQPGEIAKVFIILFLSSYLADNREMLSISERHIGPIALPRPRMFAPVFVMWGISLVVVIFERDLGSALLLFSYFIIMLYVCTGRLSYVLFSLALLLFGGFACYRIGSVGVNQFTHIVDRINSWIDPFGNRDASYQIIQSLYALAEGGLVGTGIGKGILAYVPVVESDFIFSAIGDEMGLLGGSAILICYLLLAVRGFATAARAKSDLSAFTAVGLTVSIAVQAFIIVGGDTKLLPLTGVTLPFISQGGSSLLASFIIIGLLLRCGDEGTGHGVQIENADSGTLSHTAASHTQSSTGMHILNIVHGIHARGHYGMLTPESGVLGRVALSKRLTAVVTLLAMMFAALITNLTYVQIVCASELQDDLPYNQITIARSQYVQRGSILTSDGVVLAESVLEDTGIYRRCHPQGSLAAHTVGYITTGNATGIESTANTLLCGRSDYSSWQNAFLSLAGIQTPGSSVVLTLNSQMQRAAENALEGYVGAIVVVDPSTGAILAKASSPTYSYDEDGYIIYDEENSPLVDRTIQGTYEPGSTFKTITLAAALETGTATLESTYAAPASLDINGKTVTNFHDEAWDSLSVLDGFAYSANTLFAQMGLELGAADLVEYAKAFGYGADLGQDFNCDISYIPDASVMNDWECAWAACGQPVGEGHDGGPMSTVMEGSVIAAAIANDGIAMDPYIIDHIQSPEGTTTNTTAPKILSQACSSQTASKVKEAMLEVVESGTGTYAQVSGVEVAGKTGTPETSTGANSAFIGFAPYDDPTLAISVLIIQTDDDTSVYQQASIVAGEVMAACISVQASGAAS